MTPVGSTAVKSRASNSGVYVHPALTTTKQVVATLLSTAFGGLGRVVVEVNCADLTRPGNVCAIETTADGGGTWAPTSGQSLTASGSQHFRFDLTLTFGLRVVLTSGGPGEAAPRSIPWKFNVI